MNFRCSCRHKAKISFYDFKQGHRCCKCGYKRTAEKRRHTIEYIKSCFEEYGYKVLETEYKNNRTKINYICPNDHIGTIRFHNFQNGKRCKQCDIEKHSGEGHPRYNFNLTDEEREIERNYPEYREWRKEVFERDDYTCQVSGERGGDLVAHHLEGYSPNKELRTLVSNGVTMNEYCHKLFHKKYGYRDNTREQFNEFIKIGVK
jgi:hypothetical protein